MHNYEEMYDFKDLFVKGYNKESDFDAK